MRNNLAAAIGYIVAVAGANVFIVLYSILAPWWRKAAGRHLFIFMLVIALVLDHTVIQLIWPKYEGRQTVRLGLNWAVALVIWWRILILVKVQVEKRRDAREPKDPS